MIERWFFAFALVLGSLAALPGLPLGVTAAFAQNREVPYWASIRSETVNMRVGPSRDYPIDWVYKRKGLPVKVVRVREGWRLVRDPDGAQGWISSSLLSPKRSVLVIGEDLAALRDKPRENGKLLWKVQPGVVGQLIDCTGSWCEIDIGGRKGWAKADRLWGAGKP